MIHKEKSTPVAGYSNKKPSMTVVGQERPSSNVYSMQVMNNKRLNSFSTQFHTDSREQVEERCFFLFAGNDLKKSNAFNLDLKFWKYDNPQIP